MLDGGFPLGSVSFVLFFPLPCHELPHATHTGSTNPLLSLESPFSHWSTLTDFLSLLLPNCPSASSQDTTTSRMGRAGPAYVVTSLRSARSLTSPRPCVVACARQARGGIRASAWRTPREATHCSLQGPATPRHAGPPSLLCCHARSLDFVFICSQQGREIKDSGIIMLSNPHVCTMREVRLLAGKMHMTSGGGRSTSRQDNFL